MLIIVKDVITNTKEGVTPSFFFNMSVEKEKREKRKFKRIFDIYNLFLVNKNDKQKLKDVADDLKDIEGLHEIPEDDIKEFMNSIKNYGNF